MIGGFRSVLFVKHVERWICRKITAMHVTLNGAVRELNADPVFVVCVFFFLDCWYHRRALESFRLEYDYEIEYEYGFRILNRLHSKRRRFCLLLTSRGKGSRNNIGVLFDDLEKPYSYSISFSYTNQLSKAPRFLAVHRKSYSVNVRLKTHRLAWDRVLSG